MFTNLISLFQFLPLIFERNIRGLLASLINVRETRDARLAFEALKLLAALFCHKRLVMDWVTNKGIQLLLEVSLIN